MRYIVVIFLLSLLFSCGFRNKNDNDIPIAKVFDNNLMLSEIRSFIPQNTSREDSILIARNYIKNWISKQLLVHKALDNLTPEEKDIENQVADYRTSLLIHRYKQKLIAQKLEADIAEEEIRRYYETNRYNFILSTPIVKAIFFVLPLSASNLENVRNWVRSDEAHEIENLEEYCIANAKKFDNFNNSWIELKFILNLVPGDTNLQEKAIRKSKYIECEDEENLYFLKITELFQEQNLAPLDYVRSEIIMILKNKKKIDFENELEKNINEEATRKKQVKIY